MYLRLIGAPASEVGFISATTRRGDHTVCMDMWCCWRVERLCCLWNLQQSTDRHVEVLDIRSDESSILDRTLCTFGIATRPTGLVCWNSAVCLHPSNTVHVILRSCMSARVLHVPGNAFIFYKELTVLTVGGGGVLVASASSNSKQKGQINPLQTNRRLLHLETQSGPYRAVNTSSYTKHTPLYLKTQSVPRSKHLSSYTKHRPLFKDPVRTAQ
jgi:hypothetical protein